MDHLLFGRQCGIPAPVVVPGPPGVALLDVVLGDRDLQGLREIVEVVEDPAHLVHPGTGGRRCCHEPPQDGQALDGEEVLTGDDGVLHVQATFRLWSAAWETAAHRTIKLTLWPPNANALHSAGCPAGISRSRSNTRSNRIAGSGSTRFPIGGPRPRCAESMAAMADTEP